MGEGCADILEIRQKQAFWGTQAETQQFQLSLTQPGLLSHNRWPLTWAQALHRVVRPAPPVASTPHVPRIKAWPSLQALHVPSKYHAWLISTLIKVQAGF